mmetsp:Transcript_4809/g.21991  ORF Transcript_4809/g.21991 Transcript_4809/m.21991 type:complete len:334 (+) Transcript_4809:4229-5230(+)
MISACLESVRSSRSAASARRVSASHASRAARSRSDDSRVRTAASAAATLATSASLRMASTSRSSFAFCSSCLHRSSSSCASCTSLSASRDSRSATRRASDATADASESGNPGCVFVATVDSSPTGGDFATWRPRPELSPGASFPPPGVGVFVLPVARGKSSLTPRSRLAPAAAAAATERRGESYGDVAVSFSFLPGSRSRSSDDEAFPFPRSYTRAPTSDLTSSSASSAERRSSRRRQSCIARHDSYEPPPASDGVSSTGFWSTSGIFVVVVAPPPPANPRSASKRANICSCNAFALLARSAFPGRSRPGEADGDSTGDNAPSFPGDAATYAP